MSYTKLDTLEEVNDQLKERKDIYYKTQTTYTLLKNIVNVSEILRPQTIMSRDLEKRIQVTIKEDGHEKLLIIYEGSYYNDNSNTDVKYTYINEMGRLYKKNPGSAGGRRKKSYKAKKTRRNRRRTTRKH